MLKLTARISFVLVLAACVVTPLVAQAGLVPCRGVGVITPTQQGGPGECTLNDLLVLAINVYNALLGFMALLAILVLIVSGVRMISYQFFEQPEQELESAKLMFSRAITGIVIILLAFTLVNTVLLVLGFNKAFFGGLNFFGPILPLVPAQ